jgi:hypothetical protein
MQSIIIKEFVYRVATIALASISFFGLVLQNLISQKLHGMLIALCVADHLQWDQLLS